MYKVSLKAARVNSGMTQPEAARRLGVTTQTVLNWEAGNNKISAEMLLKLCALYECPAEHIRL